MLRAKLTGDMQYFIHIIITVHVICVVQHLNATPCSLPKPDHISRRVVNYVTAETQLKSVTTTCTTACQAAGTISAVGWNQERESKIGLTSE